MTVPARTPQGVQEIQVVSANLFVLAEQYLGDATQWDRIADLNSFPGVAPDFIIPGPVAVMIPRSGSQAGAPSSSVSIETILFGSAS